MLGVDDVLLILLATTAANLVVEVGAEVVAEWWVNAPNSPVAPQMYVVKNVPLVVCVANSRVRSQRLVTVDLTIPGHVA